MLPIDLTDEDREALARHLREASNRGRSLLAPFLAFRRGLRRKPQQPTEPAPDTPISRARARWHRRTRTIRLARRLAISGVAVAILVCLAALGVDRLLEHERAPAAARAPTQAARAPAQASPIPAPARAPLQQQVEVRRASVRDPKTSDVDTEAEYQLAVMYAKGDRTNQDLPRAVAWFRKAADRGMAAAQYDLATLYENGRGVPADMQEAVKWYRLAAAQNYPLAEYNLAVAYAQGHGTPQNLAAAAKLFHEAAEQGVVPAMVNLAMFYQQGAGVSASSIDAYAWYTAAAVHGDVEARQRASALLQHMSPADKRLARELAMTVTRGIRVPPPVAAKADRPIAMRDQPSPVLASGLATPAPDHMNFALPTLDARYWSPPPATVSPATQSQSPPVAIKDPPTPVLASGLVSPAPDHLNFALPTLAALYWSPPAAAVAPAAPPNPAPPAAAAPTPRPQPAPPAAAAATPLPHAAPPTAGAPGSPAGSPPPTAAAVPRSEGVGTRPQPRMIDINGPGLKSQ